MNELSMAELFLLSWAIVATLCAVVYQTRYRKAEYACKDVSMLLCDVVVGDVKAKFDGEMYEVKSDTGLVFMCKKNPDYKGD